ncbi:MAG: DUF4438 domain-containing protein [bacterium]|nr:DUF4438 domain-containing protein [bacterium]
MMRRSTPFCALTCGMLLLTATLVFGSERKPISTNKDKLVTLAVQGKIAPAEPSRSYQVTWDGKPKMAVGIGGINYNLKIGDKVFGWASADRATVGVATVGATGEGDSDRARASWRNLTSIGNQVKVINGEAKGEYGLIIGKFESFVLIHFPAETLEKLSIGDKLHVKAVGVGLQIDRFPDFFPHGVTPELLEQIVSEKADGSLEAPVVKVIPGELAGRGAGRGSLSGNWHIQTCFPPDVEKYGLDELRFGDLVLLEDVQTDYGMGYYEGGATLGIVCSGPSDFSGLGVGVTPILSTRTGKLTGRIDPSANLGAFLEIAKPSAKVVDASPSLKTNKDALITTLVEGVVQPTGSGDYSTTYDGKPLQSLGMASINYTVSFGDPTYGWANADHVEPDVTIQGRDRERAGQCALALISCIGNSAKVVSGEAKGDEGIYLGRHAGSDDLVWFPKSTLEKLTLSDRIQVRARGVGLKIEGFDDVRVNKLSPELLEKLAIDVDDGQLVVPVVMEIPGHIMGSGLGYSPIEALDYDIQTTCPETVEKYQLKKLRLGDLVAIRDHYDAYGAGRFEDAVTIGVVIHGWSHYAGHGPGLNPILSAKPGKIKPVIDPDANVATYLGIQEG